MSDSLANALNVLSELIQPMSGAERDIVAFKLCTFALDPDGIAFDVLLAGLTAKQRQPAKIYQFSKQPLAK